MIKRFCLFIMATFIFLGCTISHPTVLRSLYISTRKANDELIQKNEQLNKEIELLKTSQETELLKTSKELDLLKTSKAIDFSEIQLLETIKSLEDKNNNSLSTINFLDQKVQQLQKDKDRLVRERSSTRIKVNGMKQSNSDLNVLIARLTERMKNLRQPGSTGPDVAIARKEDLTKPEEPVEVAKDSTRSELESEPQKSSPPKKPDKKDIQELVVRWKTAWEKKDIQAYIKFYSPRFMGGGTNFFSWYNQTFDTLSSQTNISIKIADIKIETTNDGDVVVKFLQHLNADNYSDVGIRTLRWRIESNAWKIIEEKWKSTAKSGAISRIMPPAPDKPVAEIEQSVASESKTEFEVEFGEPLPEIIEEDLIDPTKKERTAKSKERPSGSVDVTKAAALHAEQPHQPTSAENATTTKPDKKDIKVLVARWKTAWEKKDLLAYSKFYSPRFRGQGLDFDSWNKRKSNTFRLKKKIRIKIANIKTQKRQNGDIVFNFLQYYSADNYSDVGIKTLRWRIESDGWKIVEEKWKPKK